MSTAQRASPAPVVGADDPRLDPVRALRSRARDPSARVVVEGTIAVARALQGPLPVALVVGTDAALRALGPEALTRAHCVLEAPTAILEQVTGYPFHRGCLAAVERPGPLTDPGAAVPAGASWSVLVIVGLSDPRNVGALIRTAAALGVERVIVAGGADPFERRSVRASMGHVLRRPPVVTADPQAVVGALRRAGAVVVAATPAADARDVGDVPAPQQLAVIVGHEGEGLPARILEAAHATVRVPIDPEADSLGVVAATAIVLHALRRGG